MEEGWVGDPTPTAHLCDGGASGRSGLLSPLPTVSMALLRREASGTPTVWPGAGRSAPSPRSPVRGVGHSLEAPGAAEGGLGPALPPEKPGTGQSR